MTVMTLGELALLVEGRVIGDAELRIDNALPLQSAQPGCITLVDNARHAADLEASSASCAVVPADFPTSAKTLLVVAKPHMAFETIIQSLRPRHQAIRQGVHTSAFVHPSAKLGSGSVVHPNASIGENCVIGSNTIIHAGVHVMANCHVGSECELFPNCTLYEGCRVGDRVILHASCTLGAYGFGYRMVQGKHIRTGQYGWVEVGHDVEIGAGTTVDRGTYGPTVIGEGTKIDNQVMIGHNCRIGKHNLLCAQVGIAGSCSTGDYVVMGGQVGMKDHIHVADRVVIAAQSGVMNDIPAGEVWQGAPAGPQKQMMLQVAVARRLPEMRTQIRQLEQAIEELRAKLESPENMHLDSNSDAVSVDSNSLQHRAA